MRFASTILVLALAAATGAAGEPGAGAPAPATGKAAVTIQVLSAQPGDGSTGDGVDPRLAAKLRVSLEQMGMRKPDITSMAKPRTTQVGPGDTAAASQGGSGLEATCKAVDADGVALSIVLFSDVKEGKKTARKYSDPTTVRFSKPGQVQPFVQGDGKTVRVYVVSASREGGEAGQSK
ncbi:MAG TPA: hypothetical protein PK280_03830 [Planctomycetota bacterium]|nr:hypothetical protein [Planctomycetota bacterium]